MMTRNTKHLLLILVLGAIGLTDKLAAADKCSSAETRMEGGRLVCNECAGYPDYIKKHETIGEAKKLPEGFVIWGPGNFSEFFDGPIHISPLSTYEPRAIPNTSGASRFEISSDGQWILAWSGGRWTAEKPFLIRPDGSGKTPVPIPSQITALRWVSLIRNGPHGLEILLGQGGGGRNKVSQLYGVRLDLSGPTPVFGEVRQIADFKIHPMVIGPDRKIQMSGDTIFASADIPDARMPSIAPVWVTVPDGGRGLATDADLAWAATYGTFTCGMTQSHDGRISAYNPAGTDKRIARIIFVQPPAPPHATGELGKPPGLSRQTSPEHQLGAVLDGKVRVWIVPFPRLQQQQRIPGHTTPRGFALSKQAWLRSR